MDSNQQKYITYGVMGLGVLFVVWMAVNSRSNVPETTSNTNTTTTQNDSVVRLKATITNRAYRPDRIDVPFGSTVELTVTNNDNEQHGLFLQDFGVQDVVGPNETKTVRFVANQKGESATFCSAAHPEKLIISVY